MKILPIEKIRDRVFRSKPRHTLKRKVSKPFSSFLRDELKKIGVHNGQA